MIAHTDAYLRLRQQAQDLFNFIKLVCHSVPLLKTELKARTSGKTEDALPNPDYFPAGTTSNEELLLWASSYKRKLASYILLSSFSFLEAYIDGAINEVIDYHGGVEAFQKLAEKRARTFITKQKAEIKKHKRKLQEREKPGKQGRYRKHSKELVSIGYRFPTELFSSYGVRALVAAKKNLRAYQIPELLIEALHMDLCPATAERFHNIRYLRNKIAHGELVNLPLRQVMGMNRDLKNLAQKIDRHLVEHFFVIEKYAKVG